MKKKFDPHAEAVEILNKPGRYVVLRQYVDGGPIHHDSDYGKGYDAETASMLVSEFNRKSEAVKR